MNETIKKAITNKAAYETMTAEEAWKNYLWGVEATETVYRLEAESMEIFVTTCDPSYVSDDAEVGYICEINDDEGCLAGQGFGETFEEAAAEAIEDASHIWQEEENDVR